MLYFNLAPIFKARQIDKPYTFLVKAGISPNTASRIVGNQMDSIRLSHIDLLCRILYCQPNDILAYRTNPSTPLPEKHPLLALIPTAEIEDWSQHIRTLPLEKLKEISKIIKEAQ